jgi:ribosomal protein L29
MSKKHRLIIEDVRKMTDEELTVELGAQRGKLFNARSQTVTEKIEDTSQFGDYKRNIARLLTEQSQRRAKSDGKPAAPAASATSTRKKTTRKTAKAAVR